MTQQYLVGEFSLILGELQAVATSEAAVRDVAQLRQEAESTPPTALGLVVLRAVKLVDRLCWETLQQGEIEAFIREMTICAELWEFGVCAGVLEEGQSSIENRRS